MDYAIIPDPIKVHLVGISQPIQLRDQSGCVLGVFTPDPGQAASVFPFTLEELDEAAAEPGGKSLEEIWRSLGAK